MFSRKETRCEPHPAPDFPCLSLKGGRIVSSTSHPEISHVIPPPASPPGVPPGTHVETTLGIGGTLGHGRPPVVALMTRPRRTTRTLEGFLEVPPIVYYRILELDHSGTRGVGTKRSLLTLFTILPEYWYIITSLPPSLHFLYTEG